MADYYDLLDIPRNASIDDIKKSYRKLAFKYHPDRNKGSKDMEDLFKEVTEAYEVLSDPEKRSVYDRYGEQGLKGSMGGAGGFDFSDAIEIFMRDFGGAGGLGDLFGGRHRGAPHTSRQGQTIKIKVPLTLIDVKRGTTKTIRVSVLGSCDSCDGTGATEGSGPVACSACSGSGEERHVQRSVFGQFVSVSTCRTCGGEGTLIDNPCTKCKGDGRTRTQKEIEVEIPAGVTSDNFITLRGEGNIGPRGGSQGDIIAVLEVERDTIFVRNGMNLGYELPITFSQAALGDEVEVPTVDGTVSLTIPPGIQNGEILRISGYGLPELNGRNVGDQLVYIVVWTPDNLTANQEEIFQELRNVENSAPGKIKRELQKSLWSRVKEAFT